MTERVHRLVMHAFRGIPGEMTVDFGEGESVVVYGDNGTGKSTIADALEWYFRGEIELLTYEGRQHAVRYVGSETDGVTSVEVVTSGTLGGKVVFPDERPPETFACRRETFLLRGRTLADFINKTKTEKWKALVDILGLDAIESLREDLQRARNELRKLAKHWQDDVRTYRLALGSGAEEVSHQTVLASLQQICGMLGVDPPASLDQIADPSWLTDAVGASASGSDHSDRDTLLAEIKTLNTPALDRRAVEAWNDLVSSDLARRLPRASLVREAKRLVETGSIDKGRCPLCGQTVDYKTLVRRIESALVEMMEASRELERFREPIVQQADDLGAARQTRVHSRSRARRGHRVAARSRHPLRAPQTQRRRTGACRRRRDHWRSVRAAQVGSGSWHDRSESIVRQTQHTRHAARDAGRSVSAGERLAAGREEGDASSSLA